MDHEIKKQWVDALRSGQYPQTNRVLRSSGTVPAFCCLGVLCEVLPDVTWDSGESRYKWENYSMNTSPVEELNKLLGLDKPVSNRGGLAEPLYDRLMNMNDVECNDFNEIADYLEEIDF
jgi:hypothetical protein